MRGGKDEYRIKKGEIRKEEGESKEEGRLEEGEERKRQDQAQRAER